MRAQDAKDCGVVVFWLVMAGIVIGAAFGLVDGAIATPMDEDMPGQRCGYQCSAQTFCCCQTVPGKERRSVIDCDRCWCPVSGEPIPVMPMADGSWSPAVGH